MNRKYTVSELQELSDLHVLAISHASLKLVQIAHKEDPLALTERVLLDAFLCGASPEVLRFLVEKKGSDCEEISTYVAKTFLAAMPFLEPGKNTAEATNHLVHLTDIVQGFPENLINVNGNSPYCPLNIVLFSTRFPRNMVDSLIRALPEKNQDGPERYFALHDHQGDYETLPDDANFRRRMITSLNSDRCINAIGAILEKVDEVGFYRRFTGQELSKILMLLFRGKNAARKVHLEVILDPSEEGAAGEGRLQKIVSPVEEQLKLSNGKCPIEEFSITYDSTLPKQDFAIHSLLLYMKNLKRIEICIPDSWRITQEVCTTLCDFVKNRGLETLEVDGETETEGLFLPLLNAVKRSKTLTDIRLQNLQNQGEVKTYQDKVLEILKTNTNLKEVLISADCIADAALADSATTISLHVNKERFLDGTKGNDKQRRIDYVTLLNYCNRSAAKDDSTSLQDFVQFLNSEYLQDRLEFLGFKGNDEQDLVTMMQHGLLREKPSLWAPCGSRVVVGTVQLQQARCSPRSSTSPTSQRKRKATEPPEGSS